MLTRPVTPVDLGKDLAAARRSRGQVLANGAGALSTTTAPIRGARASPGDLSLLLSGYAESWRIDELDDIEDDDNEDHAWPDEPA